MTRELRQPCICSVLTLLCDNPLDRAVPPIEQPKASPNYGHVIQSQTFTGNARPITACQFPNRMVPITGTSRPRNPETAFPRILYDAFAHPFQQPTPPLNVAKPTTNGHCRAPENKREHTDKMGIWDAFTDMVEAVTPWSVVEAEAPAEDTEVGCHQ